MQELLKCLASIARTGSGYGDSWSIQGVVEAMACGSVKDIRSNVEGYLVADKCLSEGTTGDFFPYTN